MMTRHMPTCQFLTHACLAHSLQLLARLAFHINTHFRFLRPHVLMRTFVLRHLCAFVYEHIYSSLQFGSSSRDHQLITILIGSLLSHINSSRFLSTHLCTQDSIHTTLCSTLNNAINSLPPMRLYIDSTYVAARHIISSLTL